MNLLAHTYLSGSSGEILTGNLMGDFVKGKDYKKYPKDISKGIILHRHIDTFTDNHEIVRNSKNMFHESYGKYAGVTVDIIYDHFLASDWEHFSDEKLDTYIDNIKSRLLPYYTVIPEKVKKFFIRFFSKGWMNTYKNIDGIEHVLRMMSVHTSLPDAVDAGMEALKKNYDALKGDFYEFFPLIINSVEDKYDISIVRTFKAS